MSANFRGFQTPLAPLVSSAMVSICSWPPGHFCQKCPFSSAKKWHFERPNLQTDSKNLAKHPPKWWGRHLVHAFPFSGEYQANFWKLPILAPLGALFPLPRTPNFRFWALLTTLKLPCDGRKKFQHFYFLAQANDRMRFRQTLRPTNTYRSTGKLLHVLTLVGILYWSFKI